MSDWNDWRWQLRNRVRDLPGLERVLRLSSDERQAIAKLGDRLPVGITPHYAALRLAGRRLRGPRRAE